MKINGVDGFHEQKDGSVVCKHRDVSCCKECFAQCDQLVDVYGCVYWVPDKNELDDPTCFDDMPWGGSK